MNGSNSRELVTVATYWDPMEAQIARLRLAHEGIPAYLEKEFTVQMAWHFTNAFDGIRLVVPQVNCDEAQRLLRIKEVYSDWSESRCWELEMNGVSVVVEDDATAAACDHEYRQPLSPREQLAERALRAAVLGLQWEIPFLFACVHVWRFYATEGACRPSYLRKAHWARRLTALVAALWLAVILLISISLVGRVYVPSTIHREHVRLSPPINAFRP